MPTSTNKIKKEKTVDKPSTHGPVEPIHTAASIAR